MIIGISGKIKSGKDLAGNIIQYLYYLNSDIHENNKISFEEFTKTERNNNLLIQSVIPEIHKFADALKDIVCIILGCTREKLEDRLFKETELGEEWWYFIKSTNIGTTELVPYLSNEWMLPHAVIQKLTPRLLLQLMGTECGRQIIHPNIWVNATMTKYKHLPTNSFGNRQIDDIDDMPYNCPNWIITDVRFPNEVEAIKNKGGIVIRLQRDICPVCKIDRSKMSINCSETLCPNRTRTRFSKQNKEHESETALDNYKFDYLVDNTGTIEELIEKIRDILIKEKLIQ